MAAPVEQTKESTFKEKPEIEVGNELLTWTAPIRPFKRMNREFWVTVIAMASIVGLVLFFAEGFMPVILIVSIVFLIYVLTTVEPEKIEYQITGKGVKIGEKLFEWNSLIRFWFGKRLDSEILIVQKYGVPDRIEMVLGTANKDQMRRILKEHIPEEKATPTSLDKAADWFSKKIPGMD